MKKIALAVSSALIAGSVAAADVTLYGVVDTGFAYTNTRNKIGGSLQPPLPSLSVSRTGSTKSFSMESGQSAGSRWGLKGTEDLGNGLKVGFVLESGFNSDNGASGQGGRLFGRESSINLSGSFGTIYAGRMGSLISDVGSVGWYGSMASPFGSGWGSIHGHEAVMSMQGRLDNTIVYMSPRFAGLQFSAQYSMGDNDSENKPKTDRYAAIGVDYQAGNLEVGFLADYTNVKSTRNEAADALATDINGSYKFEDTWTANLAANYDFGFLKAFAAAQYFKNAHDIDGVLGGKADSALARIDNTTVTTIADLALRLVNLTGFGVNLGASVPVSFGGDFMIGAGYVDADVKTKISLNGQSAGKFGKLTGYTVLAGYQYPFSKRTKVYTGAGWTKYKVESKGWLASLAKGDVQTQTFQVMAGLVHKF